MFITFRRWTLVYILCLISLVIGFALIMQQGTGIQTPAFALAGTELPILIIDPGHGGEDGGAVASDGTVEAQINLSIGTLAAELARFIGWDVCMTRDEDVSIHDSTAQTLREKKVSDLKNRVEMCNRVGNGVLISIHQNSLPSAKSVSGAQVFFNENAASAELAQAIQTTLNLTVNNGRNKDAKAIGDSSYLMKNVRIPAVLVECGFLSNDTEAQLLKTGDYQRKLVVCIISSAAKHLSESEK